MPMNSGSSASTLLLGTRKGLFTATRGGGGWKLSGPTFPGVNLSMVLADRRDGAWYAALAYGHFGNKIQRSDDGGRTWKEIAAPVYPPKPEGVADIVCPVRQKVVPWSLELIWSLEPAGEDQPGALWCGTLPGGLFRSNDRGESWQLVRTLWDIPQRAKWTGGGYDWPGIHSICVDPRDSRVISIAVSCGGVWRTEDGGANWRNTSTGMRACYMPPELQNDMDGQDPHRMVQCAADPRRAWVQHHCGIFRSDDAGVSWREIDAVKPSGFGFAVAVHPSDPDTAWFVPAVKDEIRIPVDGAVCVTRTRDGGRSFEQLRNGLPQEHAYHLVYRHALDVDASGEVLAMGSTTGGLFISEDGGENWQTVTRDLPPIHALRFG